MATLTDIFTADSDPSWLPLKQRIASACLLKAYAIAALATPTAKQIAWAQACMLDPRSVAASAFHYALADNSSLTVAQIQAATDSAIQTSINNAVDKLLSL